MRHTHPVRPSTVAVAATLALLAAAWPAHGATKKAPAASSKTVKSAAPAELVPPPAEKDQIDAALQVFYGTYQCEFNQQIDIVASPKYLSYVEVKHGKTDYLMKPVLSSTGAVRLEDVRGETLMVQIASKSMLLNVKTAHRVVDDCVSPKQREWMEAAKAAKEQELAAAASNPSSGAPAAASSGALLKSAE
jgi:hypothetical protein